MGIPVWGNLDMAIGSIFFKWHKVSSLFDLAIFKWKIKVCKTPFAQMFHKSAFNAKHH